MPDLIDRDELKNRLKWGWTNDRFVLRTIDEMPEVDAVPVVVRCKDCKWYRYGEYLEELKFCYRLKDLGGNRIGYLFADNDFCSHGEREEE